MTVSPLGDLCMYDISAFVYNELTVNGSITQRVIQCGVSPNNVLGEGREGGGNSATNVLAPDGTSDSLNHLVHTFFF